MADFAPRLPCPMDDRRRPTGRRRWHWVACLVGAVLLGTGCNPAAMSYFLLLGKDDRTDPECKLAARDKEVKLVILASHAGLETRPELVQADRDLADRLAQA